MNLNINGKQFLIVLPDFVTNVGNEWYQEEDGGRG